MAEYSREHSEITGIRYYDFSYKEILIDLENGQYKSCICEGLGTFGVHKNNDIYYLVVTYDGELAEYSLFLKAFKDKLDNKSN